MGAPFFVVMCADATPLELRVISPISMSKDVSVAVSFGEDIVCRPANARHEE